jgi:hypothetical protein
MATFQKNGTRANAARVNGAARTQMQTTETSVMASIDDLLRDHQASVERAASDARVRAEEEALERARAIRRAADAEAERIRAEEEAARQRAMDDERRAAELLAMREATLTRARMDADARARLAELSARQDHEKQLHAILHDKSKKKWKVATALTGVVLAVALGVGGFALHTQNEKQRAAERALDGARAQLADSEADMAKTKAQLDQATDPEKIRALQRELDDKEQKIRDLQKKVGAAAPRRIATATAAPTTTAPAKPCICLEGDPTCSCIKI